MDGLKREHLFFEYETIVRSSAWSFGHSDPDPSSVSVDGLGFRPQQTENEWPPENGFKPIVSDLYFWEMS